MFQNIGWEYYEKCLSIMYSYVVHSGHVFRPTAALASVPEPVSNNAKEDESNTTIDHPAGPSAAAHPTSANPGNSHRCHSVIVP